MRVISKYSKSQFLFFSHFFHYQKSAQKVNKLKLATSLKHAQHDCPKQAKESKLKIICKTIF
jgi:hypothetical protein